MEKYQKKFPQCAKSKEILQTCGIYKGGWLKVREKEITLWTQLFKQIYRYYGQISMTE